MFGAILGDIIGSPYEFDRGNKSKDFLFFDKGCSFTDDTVMTVAVADALMNVDLHPIRHVLYSLLTSVMFFISGYAIFKKSDLN